MNNFFDTIKNITVKLTMAILTTAYPAFADPTAEEFVLYVESGIAFTEQCIAQELISYTDVHNENHRALESSGIIDSADWWAAIRSGSNGDVYDLIKGAWIKIPFSSHTCELMLKEQVKVNNSLSRYE